MIDLDENRLAVAKEFGAMGCILGSLLAQDARGVIGSEVGPISLPLASARQTA